MKAIQFIPTMEKHATHSAVLIEEPAGESGSFQLLWGDDDLLHSAEISGESTTSELLATLHYRSESGQSAWYLVTGMHKGHCLAVNGITPPLRLMRLEPGTLLSVRDNIWMVATVWTPEPVEVPEELRDKSCPVCGGELHFARVVQCSCGRWTHLERPDAPRDDGNVLNCYLQSDTCSSCDRPTTLEPQVMPDVPETLLPPTEEDDRWLFEELEGVLNGSVL